MIQAIRSCEVKRILLTHDGIHAARLVDEPFALEARPDEKVGAALVPDGSSPAEPSALDLISVGEL